MTGSAIPRGRLAEIVDAARERTGVPGVAAGLLVDGETELAAAGELAHGGGGPVRAETPFRIASVTKWFTASLAASCLDLDAPIGGAAAGASARQLLSHTAGLRQEAASPLPPEAQGLWSYSNAGYWAIGEACAAACGLPFEEAMEERVLAPLGLAATGFAEPAGGGVARGHVQEGETGHRALGRDGYPESRRPSGGLWSTVPDLLRFAAHQLGGPGPLSASQLASLREPQARALGARYCLGCWHRELAGDRVAFDHDGSVGGYQSLVLLVPAERAALAVLTNSWRGSGLIRRVVQRLGLAPQTISAGEGDGGGLPETGRFELDGSEALVERRAGSWQVAEAETDPVAGVRIERPPYPLEPLGAGVFGFAGGLLMSHRVDFPRPGVARVGWVALPRAPA